MTALPMIFGDGVMDVHVANGVARITLGAAAAQPQGEAKAMPSGTLIVPVLQLPALARVMVEITRQIEQRAKASAGQAQDAAPEAAQSDAVSGAFRFNG